MRDLTPQTVTVYCTACAVTALLQKKERGLLSVHYSTPYS